MALKDYKRPHLTLPLKNHGEPSTWSLGVITCSCAQGLKEGARQGLHDQKGNVVRGLKEGAQRTVKNMFSSSPLSKESKIQQLEKEIQAMEESLKGT